MATTTAHQEASALYQTFRRAELALSIAYNETNFYAESDALVALHEHLEAHGLTGSVFDPFAKPLRAAA